jgi:hypothetical protein
MTAQRDVRPWLVMVGLLAVLATSVLADVRPPDGVWGLVGLLAFRPVVRVALVVLAALLAEDAAGAAISLLSVAGAGWWLVRRRREMA